MIQPSARRANAPPFALAFLSAPLLLALVACGTGAGSTATRALALGVDAGLAVDGGTSTAPVIIQDAIPTAGVGIPYVYNGQGRILTAGGTATQFSACDAPVGFQVDPSTGSVRWTPTTAGTFSICVSASNGTVSVNYTFVVTVMEVTGNEPVAELLDTPSFGPADLLVSFDGSGSSADSSTRVTSYRLEFGDGEPPVYQQTADHHYALAGGYTASLTITDGFGRTSTAGQGITVTTKDGTEPPAAQIKASTLGGEEPLDVDLECDCGSTVQALRWTIDGQDQTEPKLHQTFHAGVHTVHLIAVDSSGLTAQDTVQIKVTGTQGAVPPSCQLYASAATGTAPLSLTFQAEIRAGTGTLHAPTLTLPNGTTQSGTQADFTASAPGRYLATLQVTDSNGLGCSDSVEVLALDAAGTVPPRIVSAPPAPSTDCSGYAYAPIAAGSQPMQWSLGPSASSGAPTGVILDPATGVVKLDTTVSRTASFTLIASNAAGSASQPVQLALSGCALKANVGGCTAAGDEAGALSQAGIWAFALLFLLLQRRGRRARK